MWTNVQNILSLKPQYFSIWVINDAASVKRVLSSECVIKGTAAWLFTVKKQLTKFTLMVCHTVLPRTGCVSYTHGSRWKLRITVSFSRDMLYCVCLNPFRALYSYPEGCLLSYEFEIQWTRIYRTWLYWITPYIGYIFLSLLSKTIEIPSYI